MHAESAITDSKATSSNFTIQKEKIFEIIHTGTYQYIRYRFQFKISSFLHKNIYWYGQPYQ